MSQVARKFVLALPEERREKVEKELARLASARASA